MFRLGIPERQNKQTPGVVSLGVLIGLGFLW
jgi:hypothetical protein